MNREWEPRGSQPYKKNYRKLRNAKSVGQKESGPGKSTPTGYPIAKDIHTRSNIYLYIHTYAHTYTYIYIHVHIYACYSNY